MRCGWGGAQEGRSTGAPCNVVGYRGQFLQGIQRGNTQCNATGTKTERYTVTECTQVSNNWVAPPPQIELFFHNKHFKNKETSLPSIHNH